MQRDISYLPDEDMVLLCTEGRYELDRDETWSRSDRVEEAVREEKRKADELVAAADEMQRMAVALREQTHRSIGAMT